MWHFQMLSLYLCMFQPTLPSSTEHAPVMFYQLPSNTAPDKPNLLVIGQYSPSSPNPNPKISKPWSNQKKVAVSLYVSQKWNDVCHLGRNKPKQNKVKNDPVSVGRCSSLGLLWPAVWATAGRTKGAAPSSSQLVNWSHRMTLWVCLFFGLVVFPVNGGFWFLADWRRAAQLSHRHGLLF